VVSKVRSHLRSHSMILVSLSVGRISGVAMSATH
jgi:hypothetical protein